MADFPTGMKEFLDRAMEVGEAQVIPADIKQNQFLVVPNNCTLKDLNDIYDKTLEHPRRKQGAVSFDDLTSFCQYFIDHEIEGTSRVFADVNKQKFTALLDYHGKGELPAGWKGHKATFALMATPEWLAWTGHNKKRMDQEDLAEFLEINASDIIEPSAAAMQDVARQLNIKEDVNFTTSQKLSNGMVQINYTKNVNGTIGVDKAQVPETFKIRISPFIGVEPLEITAFFRYRLSGGSAELWFELYRIDKIVQDAFYNAVKTIGTTTGTQVLLGRVEA